MQVVLHQFPGAQVEYRFKCRTPGIDLVPCIAEIEEEIERAVLAALSRRRAAMAAQPALHQERLRRLPRPVPDEPQVRADRAVGEGQRRDRHRRRGARGCTRSCSRSRCSRSSTRSTSAARSPIPTSPKAAAGCGRSSRLITRRRRPRRLQDRRLRHAPALLARLAGRGAADRAADARTAARRDQQHVVRDDAQPRAARHDGARVSAGLSVARTAAARLADVRVRALGARISRRPRHRAVRRLRLRRVPARLRHVLLQALRRRAPRLGRPGRVGRADDRALRALPDRPADEDADLLRQPRHPARHRAASDASRRARGSRSASARTSRTTSATRRCRSSSRWSAATASRSRSCPTRRRRTCATTRPTSPTCGRSSRSPPRRSERRPPLGRRHRATSNG